MPRSGDLLRVTRAASAQFTTRPIVFRVIRVQDWYTPDGWIWLDGYELDAAGDAVDRRSIYVLTRGLMSAASATRTVQIHATPPNASRRAAEPLLRPQNSRPVTRVKDGR